LNVSVVILTKATFALCFFVLVVHVSLSVLVQVIDWKFSSPKWPIVCRWGTLNPTHSLTHSLTVVFNVDCYSNCSQQATVLLVEINIFVTHRPLALESWHKRTWCPLLFRSHTGCSEAQCVSAGWRLEEHLAHMHQEIKGITG